MDSFFGLRCGLKNLTKRLAFKSFSNPTLYKYLQFIQCRNRYHHFLTHTCGFPILPLTCVCHLTFFFFFHVVGGPLDYIGHNPQLGRKRIFVFLFFCPISSSRLASMTSSPFVITNHWLLLYTINPSTCCMGFVAVSSLCFSSTGPSKII